MMLGLVALDLGLRALHICGG
ncbi:hypothetical protein SPHV1_2430006 [Novosphingobium sp. KN65.2]|nr:hypothetical protein SPHV1_2430006 [Novosphingobium sp. KN65.2]